MKIVKAVVCENIHFNTLFCIIRGCYNPVLEILLIKLEVNSSLDLKLFSPVCDFNMRCSQCPELVKELLLAILKSDTFVLTPIYFQDEVSDKVMTCTYILLYSV
jgi:hypothetical protein